MCFKFWPVKTIFRKLKPMRIWLRLAYKFINNCSRLRLFSEFIQTQKWYTTSLDKMRILTIKLKFFLWANRLENLILAKCLKSVAAPF